MNGRWVNLTAVQLAVPLVVAVPVVPAVPAAAVVAAPEQAVTAVAACPTPPTVLESTHHLSAYVTE
jgi:hypothetical protein